MIEQKITCDVCGVERKAVNHWYLVRANGSGFHLPTQRKTGDKDVCGQSCAHKMLDRWLATRSLDKETP